MEVINSVTMLSIALTGAALIREREHGTIAHLLVMPVTPFEIMTAKVWAMALVVLAACAFPLIFIVQGRLAVPIEGSIALLLAGAAMHLFATASMGIFLGTIARSMPQFGLFLILVLLPLQMLSVGPTPRERKRAAVIAPPLPPPHRASPLPPRHCEERSDVATQKRPRRRLLDGSGTGLLRRGSLLAMTGKDSSHRHCEPAAKRARQSSTPRHRERKRRASG